MSLLLDRILTEVNHALDTVFNAKPQHYRQSPADKIIDDTALTEKEKKLSAELLRVDHTGEVCAQALYRGHALVTKNKATRADFLKAADEEQDHLAWCQGRLDAYNAHTSYLNPFWYTGSFLMGVGAGFLGDAWSYGFVEETEKQVEAHLDEHLTRLPGNDAKSRAVLLQMKQDEVAHAQHAKVQGAKALPIPIKRVMGVKATLMKQLAAKI